MADEEEKPASTIPEWQRAQNNGNEADQPEETSQDKADQPEQTQPEEEDKFVVARRFLADEQVKDSSRERKVAFLKEKGIDDADIENLLQEAGPSSSPVPSTVRSVPSSPCAHQLLTCISLANHLNSSRIHPLQFFF